MPDARRPTAEGPTARLALFAAALLVVAGCQGACGTETPDANVLLITVDSLRVDRLGPWNEDSVPVPALEGLAERGVLYRNAWATAPWTAPAVVSVFTGLYPTSHGVAYRDDTTPPGLPSLPRLLTDTHRLGNLSFFSGLSYFRNLGLPEPEPGLGHHAPAESFRRFLDREPGDGEARRPFFAWIHLLEPHLPYGATGYRATEVQVSGSSGLETAQLRAELPVGSAEFAPGDRARLLELYDRDVAAMDEELGKILAVLEERGLTESTLVVLVADHGEELLEHGWVGHASTAIEAKLVPEILRVPMVLAGPGVQAGRVVEELTQPVDLFPALLRLLGLSVPKPTDGVVPAPFRPFWRGARETAFFDSSAGGNLTPVERRGERIQGATGGACLTALHHRPGEPPERSERPLVDGGCGDGRPDALERRLERWRGNQSEQRLALLTGDGSPPSEQTIAGYTEALTVTTPADGATLGWEEAGGQVRLGWQAEEEEPAARGADDGAEYWIEYRVGEGALSTRGSFRVEQRRISFGPFPRGFWNDLARHSPFRFRVLEPAAERRSPWTEFRVRTIGETPR